MKTKRFLWNACMAVCMSLSATLLTGCSDDDEKVNEPETPEEKPEEKPSEGPDQPEEPEVKNTYRFDLFVCAKNHGGMSQNKNGTFVRSVPALTADQPMVEFSGKGIDITQSYTMESITKGKYYYQVPQSSADRFSKFQILTDAEGDEYIQTVAEVPFKENTYYARKYTHAWTDDATLVIVGTDAAHKVVYWSKLKDTDTSLSIESEGTLDIPLPENASALSTSGILTYRASDKKLYYFYNAKIAAGITQSSTSTLYIAIIDPATMKVESNLPVDKALAEEIAASAYGELMQNTVMYDDQDNLYLACLKTINNQECGTLLRMNAGQTTFDPTYNGFPNPEGKLLTIQFTGHGKALAYSSNNELGTGKNDVSYFYSIIRLADGSRERLKFNGQEMRYCSGRFSQRSVVVDGKTYFGLTEGTGEDEYPTIYIYDAETDSVEEGIKLSKGFCFDIIRVMEAEE